MILSDDAPCKSFPQVNWIIIIISALVFAAEFFILKDNAKYFVLQWGMVPARLLADRDLYNCATLFTHWFIHYEVIGLFLSLQYLYIFGDNIEDRMGSPRYLFFCLICGLAACLVQIIKDPSLEMPIIGLSGIISGVLGAYMVSYPDAKIMITLTPIMWGPRMWSNTNISALTLILGWLVYQALPIFLPLIRDLMQTSTPLPYVTETLDVSWFSNIASFAVGVILVKIFEQPDQTYDNPNSIQMNQDEKGSVN